MKLLKKIAVTLISIILVLLVTFNVYNFVCIQLLHKDLAKVNGYALLEVVSGSMEPTIMVGDLILIDTNWKNYEKDDIITFRDVNEAFVTHRIIEIDNEKKTMVTQGDANPSPDEEMSTNRIVGKYKIKIPGVGKVMSSFKNPLVMILILVIGIIVCALASTDGDLVPKDLSDEEKEFLEYKKNKEKQEKEEVVEEKKTRKKKVEEEKIKKTPSKKSTTSKKVVVSDTPKKSSTKTLDEKKKTTKKADIKIEPKRVAKTQTTKKVETSKTVKSATASTKKTTHAKTQTGSKTKQTTKKTK